MSNLGTFCGAENTDLCNEEERENIERLKSLGIDKLEEEIRKIDMAVFDAEDALDDEINKLQDRQEKLKMEKDRAIEVLEEDIGLVLMKDVLFYLEHQERWNPTPTKPVHDEL